MKWIESRSENMVAAHHGRDQITTCTLAAKRDGTLTGCHVRIIADLGAYHLLLTPFIPALGFPVMGGCYKIPAIDLTFEGVFTNKCPHRRDPRRRAARGDALDRADDRQARGRARHGSARAAAQELHPQGRVPGATPRPGITYDSGDYDETLDRLLERFDLDAFRREQEELRERGIYRGIGFSTYTEICGLAPSRVVGPQGVGLQAAAGSPRWSASTPPVR